MKTLSTFVFGLLVTAGLATQLSAAPQFGAGRDRNQGGGRDRVCIFQDVSYQGAERCYNVGDEVTSLDHNAQASSIRIYGRASVVVYEETNFRGHSAEFSSDIPDLKLRAVGNGHTWNDRISSLRVVSDYNTGRYPGNSNPNPYPNNSGVFRGTPQGQGINDGICVYDRRDYQGHEECFGAGTSVNDLARAGNWSDRIQSIRVFGGSRAVLYRDIQFRGDSIVIDRDVPDLSQVSGQNFRNWSRQISSLAVQNGRFGRDRDRGRARFYR